THFANTYDEQGRIVRQEGTDGILNATVSYETLPLSHGSRTHVTNSVGGSWTYEFDTQKRLIVETDPSGAATRTDYIDNDSRRPFRIIEADLATTYIYRNQNSNIVKIVRPDETTIQIDYYDRNRPAKIADADGGVITYHYDERGNLATRVDPDGVTRIYTYHNNGAIESTTESGRAPTTVEVNAAGLALAIVDGPRTTRITRDHFARPTAVTNPAGDVTHYTWNPEGQPLVRLDPDGYTDAWSWNTSGTIRSYTDRAGNTQSYTYGPFGLPETHINTDDSVTGYTYDTEKRVTAVTNPLGQSWNYYYDSSGRLTRESDFNQAITTYRYQPTGQLGILTPANGIPRHFVYNQLGLVTSIRAETGELLTYSYTPAGHLQTATSTNGTNAHTLRYNRTRGGRLLTQQVDHNQPIVTAYDPHGRAASRTTPAGKTTTWAYDELGRVNSVTAGRHYIALEYDHLGRPGDWRAGQLSHTHAYDKTGHLTSSALIDLGDTSHLRIDEYSWRPDGYITQHKTSGTARHAHSRNYDLDPAGRVTALITTKLGNSSTARYGYDALNNITNESFDNLVSRRTAIPLSTIAAEATKGGQQNWEYNRNLLVRHGRISYSYDNSGRLVHKKKTRISHKPDHWHYRYNAFDQLTISTRPMATGGNTRTMHMVDASPNNACQATAEYLNTMSILGIKIHS
ncbi:hypothetical protein ACFXK0_03155, partial [Nocardia sp. NPDC059177]